MTSFKILARHHNLVTAQVPGTPGKASSTRPRPQALPPNEKYEIEALLGDLPAQPEEMGVTLTLSRKTLRLPLGVLVDSPNTAGITRRGKTKIPTSVKQSAVTPTQWTPQPVQLPLPTSDAGSGAHAATPTAEKPSKEKVQDAVKRRVAELTKAYPKWTKWTKDQFTLIGALKKELRSQKMFARERQAELKQKDKIIAVHKAMLTTHMRSKERAESAHDRSVRIEAEHLQGHLALREAQLQEALAMARTSKSRLDDQLSRQLQQQQEENAAEMEAAEQHTGLLCNENESLRGELRVVGELLKKAHMAMKQLENDKDGTSKRDEMIFHILQSDIAVRCYRRILLTMQLKAKTNDELLDHFMHEHPECSSGDETNRRISDQFVLDQMRSVLETFKTTPGGDIQLHPPPITMMASTPLSCYRPASALSMYMPSTGPRPSSVRRSQRARLNRMPLVTDYLELAKSSLGIRPGTPEAYERESGFGTPSVWPREPPKSPLIEDSIHTIDPRASLEDMEPAMMGTPSMMSIDETSAMTPMALEPSVQLSSLSLAATATDPDPSLLPPPSLLWRNNSPADSPVVAIPVPPPPQSRPLRSAMKIKCTLCAGSLKNVAAKIQIRGRAYHPDCFRCSLCRNALGPTSCVLGEDGRLYCRQNCGAMAYDHQRVPYCEV